MQVRGGRSLHCGDASKFDLLPDNTGHVGHRRLDGGTGASTGGGLVVFAPSGTVTFLPPEDFAGDTGLEVTAITTDADGIFTDTARSTPADIDFDITPSPDLVIDVTEPVVELAETDLLVRHRPAGDFDIAVTDTDGSEFVDSVTYSIEGVPEGTRYRVGSGPRVDVTDTLTFTGSLDEFEDLVVIFPADFATNGTPLAGSILVTTNEGGSESGTFSVSVAGELDLSVTIDVEPDPDNEAGARQVIDFGIDAQVTDRQTTASEWLEEVVIQFDSALPAHRLDQSRNRRTRGVLDHGEPDSPVGSPDHASGRHGHQRRHPWRGERGSTRRCR